MTNPPEAHVDQRRSALYIDFDNFFGGLLRSDPQAAVRIAEVNFIGALRVLGRVAPAMAASRVSGSWRGRAVSESPIQTES